MVRFLQMRLKAIIVLLPLLSGVCVAQEENSSISAKQVSKFLSTNRSNLLFEYSCTELDTNKCGVKCSSGGATFIDVAGVSKAYYAERLNRINSALAGFFLVVDLDAKSNMSDIWATLQTESSCQFSGMAPQAK